MNLVFISVIAVTGLEIAFCGFSFMFIFSLIARIIFLTRIIGCVVPVKVSMALEACHLAIPVLGVIMNAGSDDWVKFGLTVLFCGLACLLYFIDDTGYLYVVVDEDDDSLEED